MEEASDIAECTEGNCCHTDYAVVPVLFGTDALGLFYGRSNEEPYARSVV